MAHRAARRLAERPEAIAMVPARRVASLALHICRLLAARLGVAVVARELVVTADGAPALVIEADLLHRWHRRGMAPGAVAHSEQVARMRVEVASCVVAGTGLRNTQAKDVVRMALRTRDIAVRADQRHRGIVVIEGAGVGRTRGDGGLRKPGRIAVGVRPG